MTPYRPKEPRPYRHQMAGLRKLIANHGNGALLFEPGMGKTRVVLDYLSIASLRSGGEVRALVLAPLVATDTWVDQARQYVSDDAALWAEVLGGSIRQKAYALAARNGHARGARGHRPPPRGEGYRRSVAAYVRPAVPLDGRPTSLSGPALKGGPALLGDGPRVTLEVINIEALTSRQPVGKSKTLADVVLAGVKAYAPHVVIVDELHKIRGMGSNTSRLAARIAKATPRHIGLTGTVMPKGPLDVYSQWKFLDPDSFPEGSQAFQDRYVKFGGFKGKEIKGYRNLDELQDRMAPLASVARKADALDLPDAMDVKLPVVLSRKERAAYDEIKSTKALTVDGVTIKAANPLARSMKLMQVAAGHVIDEQGVTHHLGTSMVDTITSLVHDKLADERRLVVFTRFREELRQLSASIARRGTRVDVISGDTPHAERIATRRRFGSDSSERIVLVAQISTVSMSVNELVTASHAVFATLPSRREEIVQARDRLNRIGQKNKTTFWFALAPGTIGTALYRAYRNRTDMEAALLQHIAEGDAHDRERERKMTTKTAAETKTAPPDVLDAPADADRVISYSSAGLHRKCPQAYYYGKLLGLRSPSAEVAPARDIGLWWSVLRAADALERGRALGSLAMTPRPLRLPDESEVPMEELTVPLVLSRAGRWWNTLGGDSRDAWLEKSPEPLEARLSAMYGNWQEYAAEERDALHPLGVEVKCFRVIPGTSWTLKAYLDEVFWDRRRGMTVVRDHKTMTSFRSVTTADDMMDSQLHLYAWAASPLIESWGRGKPRAVAYDRMRSAVPSSPKLTAAGALSKSTSDYDLATYLAWARGPEGNGVPWGEPDVYYKTGKRAGEPKFGLYTAEEEVVSRLSSKESREDWYRTSLRPVNANLARVHLRSLADTAADIERTRERAARSDEAPRNLTRMGCSMCEFAELCRAQMTGGARGDYPLDVYRLVDGEGHSATLTQGRVATLP